MTNNSRPGFVAVDDYLSLPRARQTWIIDPILPASGAALLYGAPKGGKSRLAVQLALAITGALPDFLGFPVKQTGQVLYLQLDTPRSIWADRFEKQIKSLTYDPKKLLLADRESIQEYPFDVLLPRHMTYLHTIIHEHSPIAVIVDTLRESHSGDSDSDTSMRNVITNLVGACHPAALVIVSHDRKGSPDMEKDIMKDHRGSSYVPGRMDVILRLTKSRLYMAGRELEEGSIKISWTGKRDEGLWMPVEDPADVVALGKTIADQSLDTPAKKAQALASQLKINHHVAMMRITRAMAELNKTISPEPELVG